MRIRHGWIVTLIFTLILTSCSSNLVTNGDNPNSADAVDQIKLRVLHNWVGQDGKSIAMRQILDEFRASHPNVILEDEGLVTEGMKTRLRALAAADEMPDLFVMWPDAMAKDFVKGDLIQPIDDFLNSKPEWRDNFISQAFTDFTVDDHIYTVPMNLAPTSLIYYNQALFDQYDVKVPTTWDELLQAIEVFNKNQIIPIALGAKSDWLIQSTIFSTLTDRILGTEWLTRALNQEGATFLDPQFIEVLQFLRDFARGGAFQNNALRIDDNQMMELYFQGNAAMFINGGWATSNIVKNAPEDILNHTHVTILPPIEGGKGKANSTSGVVGTGMGLSKKLTGARKDAALELLYALSGPEGQKATLDSSTLVSYKIDLDPDKAHPLFIELNELMQHIEITPVFDIKLSTAATEVLNIGLADILIGVRPYDIASKLQAAQAQAKSLENNDTNY
ncbi:MAG: extracellular solute-binding protein [Paenibacillaceae bacterium]